ncbi:MAG TPA: hypothetical protein VGG19_20385 [Tepidisphaeraceae bacterium]
MFGRFSILFSLGLIISMIPDASSAQWIDFSGISSNALPMTIDYGSGSVTILQISAPPVGTTELESFSPGLGKQGSKSSVGGLKMGIHDTGSGPDSWEIELAFNQPTPVTINNSETYCDFEATTLQADNPWTQLSNSSSDLIVSGVGTDTISLVGANGASGPFGYDQWTTTTTDLFMSYQLNEASGGDAGNAIEIYIPEPSELALVPAFIAGLYLARQRKQPIRSAFKSQHPNHFAG